MKKIALFLFAMFSFAGASAQNEYFQHNPEWTVFEGWTQSYPCVSYDTATFYINGDTLVNSLTYKKIYARGTGQYYWMSSNPNFNCATGVPHNYPYSGYTGCIRSDSGRVYYIHNGYTTEGLISDATLSVGDTFPLPITMMNPNETVSFIDSFYTPYGYLKKFHLTSDTSAFVLEGGGSSFGLFHYVGPMFDFASWLLCYTQNDTAWWPAQGPNCDAILLNTSPVVQPQVSLQLVPNPASDHVAVNLSGMVLQSVALYNVHGQIVKQQPGSEVYVGDLPAGIYFVRVESDAGSFTSELLIE